MKLQLVFVRLLFSFFFFFSSYWMLSLMKVHLWENSICMYLCFWCVIYLYILWVSLSSLGWYKISGILIKLSDIFITHFCFRILEKIRKRYFLNSCLFYCLRSLKCMKWPLLDVEIVCKVRNFVLPDNAWSLLIVHPFYNEILPLTKFWVHRINISAHYAIKK